MEKQDEMRQLEEELNEMDLEDRHKTPKKDETTKEGMKKEPSGPLYTRHRRDDKEAKARRRLFGRLERKYKEYAELVVLTHQMMTLEKPAKYEWKNIREFIFLNKPTVRRESEWIGEPWRNDLVSLSKEREHATVGHILELVINKFKGPESWFGGTDITQKPKKKVNANKTDSSDESNKDDQSDKADKKDGSDEVKHYYDAEELLKTPETLQQWLKSNGGSEYAADHTIHIFLLILVPFFFVVPIYALATFRDQIGKSIAVLIAFAMLFTSFLKVGTSSKMQEVFSYVAA